MASTNFLQWNPALINQETDAQYAGDSQRAGGAIDDTPFPARTANKLFYQTSTFVAAFGQMMANKGFSTSDADINVLSGVLANLLTSNDQKPTYVSVPYSPTPVFNAALANGFYFVMSGNVTSSTVINSTPGQVYTFQIYNPNGFSFVWPTNVLGAYSPTGATPNTQNMQQFVALGDGFLYSATDMLDAVVAALKTNVTTLNGQVGTLNGQVSTINGQIGTINGTLSTINGEITALQTGKQNNLGFTPVQQGGGSGQLPNKVEIGWSGTRLKGQVDADDLGNFAFDGDVSSAISTALAGAFAGNVNDVTGSRSAGATYQNTTGHILFVSGSFNGSGSQAFQVNGFTGPGSPSMRVCANQFGASTNGWPCGFGFFVPNGWFYEVTTAQTGGSLTLAGWFETSISS